MPIFYANYITEIYTLAMFSVFCPRPFLRQTRSSLRLFAGYEFTLSLATACRLPRTLGAGIRSPAGSILLLFGHGFYLWVYVSYGFMFFSWIGRDGLLWLLGVYLRDLYFIG